VNGNRVELGEVEAALASSPLIAHSAARLVDGRLIGYCVPTPLVSAELALFASAPPALDVSTLIISPQASDQTPGRPQASDQPPDLKQASDQPPDLLSDGIRPQASDETPGHPKASNQPPDFPPHDPHASDQTAAVPSDGPAVFHGGLALAVRGAALRRAPSHMVPAVIVFLKQLPLTASGKAARTQLPPPPNRSQGISSQIQSKILVK